jgi:hypothetical protein
MSRRRLLSLAALLLAAPGCRFLPSRAAAAPVDAGPDAPPAIAAIDTAALRRDLFALAGDALAGREAGTEDELRAAAWVAERAREAGLRPAGDDGTYFQFFPMRRVRTAEGARVVLDGTPLDVWSEAAIVAPVDAALSQVPMIWVGTATGDSLRRLDLRGMAVAARLVAPARPPVSWISLREWRYARAALNERIAALADAGASAVVLVADDSTDGAFASMLPQLRRGTYNIDSAATTRPAGRIPAVWVRAPMLARVRGAKRLTLNLRTDSFVHPSANVVAVAPGRDSTLRGEHVLFSGHHDHDGARQNVAGDSIWNGADDNASVSVAMLAIGRAWTRAPGRRSALFVWHGAEERGLLGSRWYVWRPTVPRASIVAVLNADMIGRNHPDTAALLGSQPPHRNSNALVGAALGANARVSGFVVDSSWDRPTHPEGWYFRSDHLPYARAGIPSVFFTTLLHADYHTPRDEPSRIDLAKLARMTRWMYATGWAVSETAARPGVVPGFGLER